MKTYFKIAELVLPLSHKIVQSGKYSPVVEMLASTEIETLRLIVAWHDDLTEDKEL